MVVPHQVKLGYTATAVGNTAAASLQAAMEAVQLYTSTTQDPVLCRAMGLSVESDVTQILGQNVTRTITLNMDETDAPPHAPQFFGLQVETVDHDAALYSTSAEDSATGIGARTVNVTYSDAEGNSATVTVALNGKTPVKIALDPSTKGVAHVTEMVIASTGSLGSSVGQITAAVFTQPTVEPSQSEPTPLDTQDAYQNALGDKLGYLPNSFLSYAIATPGGGVNYTNLVSMVTDLFTHTLSKALSTPVTAAAPVLQ